MNLTPPSPKGGLHRTLRVLSLLLIQHALVPTGPDANARTRLPADPNCDPVDSASRPYLKVSGSLAMRFAPAPRPIPLHADKPAAILPVHPTDTAPAESSQESLSHETEPVSSSNEVPAAPVKPTTNKPTRNILPDDTRPATRPEDFLPFFKFPGSGDVTVVVPASITQPPTPGQMPASSATYQQR